MSEYLQDMLEELKPRLEEASFDGTAKISVPGEGAIVFTSETAEISDADSDVTMTADADTFRAIFNKELDPTAAFMSGRLTIDGDMGMAMQLAQVLA
ncbi:SCP2 sterol-binding domain-containing protein [Marinibacterium profundimaris]|uniref:Sterol carrier family protein n=1 Tax=Marinibacterium profundimaris TaxID=1679460 RepID=A0A225NEX8_9RHOB|nr:SCP2 sterol-binding domain-containing protein [Marinibacterium profundimaris]OWU69865.1 sterol carrier family protein [Marinibacterium profundimaris]